MVSRRQDYVDDGPNSGHGPEQPLLKLQFKHTNESEHGTPLKIEAPWVCGSWGINFRELGSTGHYFRGAGEQAHTFGDLGSTAKN